MHSGSERREKGLIERNIWEGRMISDGEKRKCGKIAVTYWIENGRQRKLNWRLRKGIVSTSENGNDRNDKWGQENTSEENVNIFYSTSVPYGSSGNEIRNSISRIK